MVQLRFENLVPSSKGEQPKPAIEFTNLAGLSPAEQWFYHWVSQQNLATPYPDLELVKAVLETHLPQLTKRYARNVPDPSSGESWLRLVLMTGELLKLQLKCDLPPMTVAVYPANGEWKQGFEKINSSHFGAARRALGIDKHWILVFEGIAEAVPASEQLMNALKVQAVDLPECAVIHFHC